MQNELLSELIEIKSYSGAEGQLAEYLKSWFEKRGASVEIIDENVVVKIGGIDSSRAFIFNSHMDTVSAGDESLWKYGPWTPTVEGNRLVGLGASDMKSGLASSMILAEKYLRRKPEVDMWFTYVVREEQDGSGTAAFADWFDKSGNLAQYKDLAGIFTEPTDLTELEHGHRGNLFLLVESKGDSGHASRPDRISIHAVKKMMEFSDRLQSEMARWAMKYQKGVFAPPTVGVLTSIQAGVVVVDKKVAVASPNKFPASCVATFDVRTVPGFHERAMELIQEVGREVGVTVGLAYPGGPSGYTDPQEKIVRVASQVLGGPKLSVSFGSADLGYLTGKNVKAVILGPGQKRQCHVVNEYCFPDQIQTAVDFYEKIVTSWSIDPK